MTPNSQISSVALFYYFAFLDEKAALFATLKTWEKIKRTFQPSGDLVEGWNQFLVSATHQGFNRYQKVNPSSVHVPEGMIPTPVIPNDVSIGAWKEFRKLTPSDEFLAVLWTQILKIPDSDITHALGISRGTLKYRVARGLRQLGEVALRGRK